MLIAFAGRAGVGKDTAGDVLVRKGWVRVSFADPMKRIVKDVYQFSDDSIWGPSEKRNAPDPRYGGLTPRYALQTLGTEWGRTCWPDTWVAYALRVATQLQKGGYGYNAREGLFRTGSESTLDNIGARDVVMCDCRFPNEVAAVKAAGGKVVLLERDAGSKLDGAASQHESETALVQVPRSDYDAIIHNNASVEALRDAVALVHEHMQRSREPIFVSLSCGVVTT
jgi:hypothetical protein